MPRRRYTVLLDKAITGEPAPFKRLPADRPVPGAQALEIIAARGSKIT